MRHTKAGPWPSKASRVARTARVLATAAACSLTLVACAGVRGELVESGVSNDEGVDIELAFAVNADTATALFDFGATDLDTGVVVSGQDLRRDAPLIVTFVVPSCAVCVAEAPKLAAAAEENPEVNFVVIHSFGEVSGYVSYNAAAELTQENVVHLIDSEGALWERFGVLSQPSTVLVDAEGRVTSSRGALGDDGLTRAISRIMNDG